MTMALCMKDKSSKTTGMVRASLLLTELMYLRENSWRIDCKDKAI